MSNALTDLIREVREARDAHASAMALIRGLKERLKELADSATELQSLKDAVAGLAQELSDSTDQLVDAVTEPAADDSEKPTPADPEPVPADPVDHEVEVEIEEGQE